MSTDVSIFSDRDVSARNKVKLLTAEGITQSYANRCYDEWAETYDQELATQDFYNPPNVAANCVADLLSNDRDLKILDVGAGTGQVGKLLHGMGFRNLDALDASARMLEKAKKKSIYNRIICDYMGPNKLDITDDAYDMVVTAGAFGEGHIMHDCFPEIIRILKPGGRFVMTVDEAKLSNNQSYSSILEPFMRHYEEVGQWKMTKREVAQKYYCDRAGIIFAFEIL